MSSKIKLHLLVLLLLIFCPFFFVSAGTIDLSQICAADTDCISGKCGQSTLTGAQTKFCVCASDIQCETKFTKQTAQEVWTCKPGEDKTKGLAYCSSTTRGIQAPMAAGAAPTTTPPDATSKAGEKIVLTAPVLSIPIPGLPSFATIEVKQGEIANIPYIAQYIVAIYKYGLTLASILAVVMIMIGGAMYLISSADPAKATLAKQLIFGSITGITVLICSYLMLKIINPNLVNPSSIAVQTIPEDIIIFEAPGTGGGPSFPGGAEILPISAYPPDVKPVVGPATYKSNAYVYGVVKDKACLDAYFFSPSLALGADVASALTTINVLGLDTFWERSTPNLPRQASAAAIKRIENNKKAKWHYGILVHKRAVAGWESFTRDLLASTDPEVKGYMQYLWDRADGKAPNFDSSFEPNDITSILLGCGAGMQRRTPPCPQQVPYSSDGFPYAEPHTIGLAVDLLTRSGNWDVRAPLSKSTRGDSSAVYCNIYKNFIAKMRNGGFGEYFKTDPYKMYDRMDKIINNCLAGKSSAWSIPDGMIDLAVKNKFYWAGWSWADPWRADGMHFEYYGPCFGLKNETPRPK